MEAVYPASASALARGRRARRAEPRARRRTAPVTFAEIKEVDEESGESCSVVSAEMAAEERRRRPDVLEDRLGPQFAEFRRRRRARTALREQSPPPPAPTSERTAAAPANPAPIARAGSEPAALHRDLAADT